METTQADPVIAEVRAVRDGIAARADYDVGAVFRRIREMQDASGREYVTYPRAPDRRGLRRIAGRLNRAGLQSSRSRGNHSAILGWNGRDS